MEQLLTAILKMFDTQKEWLGWIFGILVVWMVVKLYGMPIPHELHMKALIYVLGTTLGIVVPKTFLDIFAAIKGVTKP